MFESLFGAEMPLLVRFFIALVFVVVSIFAVLWAVRRFFGGGTPGAASARGRQPRLAVIDAATVDTRRRLILIRRDNVEHLLMIGGPTDVVIEPNIVRAAAATRDAPAPSRAPGTADPLPRAVPLGDSGMWPLQPEPTPASRSPRSPAPEEPTPWPIEPELPPQPAPRRQSRPVDPLAGLAAEVARLPEPLRAPPPTDLSGPGGFVPREPARQREPVREREPSREREAAREREAVREREAPIEREPLRERETIREREPTREPAREREPVREPAREREPARMREPQAAPTEPEFNANADQNLADMAQRLEAALRRPAKANEARPAEPPPRATTADTDPGLPAHPRAAPPPGETGGARAEPKPAKSLYDSLEKEMANLLGRPSGKS